MYYSDDVIEEVRAGNDIVDVISGYVKLERRGSNYFGLCPFHNEKSPSFSVSRDKQMFYCFGCGKGGNVYTFLMDYENCSFQEAVQMLADRIGYRLPEPQYSQKAREQADEKKVLFDINREAAVYFVYRLRSPAGAKAMEYLRGRQLSDETIRNFGLGFSDIGGDRLYRYLKKKGNYSDRLLGESGLFTVDERDGFRDKFWNRVMYPIMDANSRVIGFGGRVMGDGKPKYLNSPETKIFDKSRNLYGLNIARRSRRNHFIICEGYMDVISMHQAGYTNAVASLGTSLTEQQCALMARYVHEVYVIYDMDEAGVKAALRAIPMLRSAGISTRVVNLRPHKDPDEFIKANGGEAFEERLKQAENGFLFEIRVLSEGYDRSDPQGQSDFFHAVCEKLFAEFPDEAERDFYLQDICRIYHFDPDITKREIGTISLRGTGRKTVPVRSRLDKKEEKSKRDAQDTAQRMMLTWIANEPDLIEQLSDYLSPDDFTTPFLREVADLVWEQYKNGRVNPAAVINHFPDEEQQTQVARVFHTSLQLDGDEARRQALLDVLLRMKDAAIRTKMDQLDPSDMSGLMKLMDEKKKLGELRAGGLKQITFTDME